MGIPDHICGLCYHPKDSAKTCPRTDCESYASPAGYARDLAAEDEGVADGVEIACAKTTEQK